MPNFDETTEETSIPQTILDIDTSDAQEPSCVDPGEYKIRITGFRKDQSGNIVRTSDSGNRYFIMTFDIPDEEFSKGLSKIFSLPNKDHDAKQTNAIKWNLECFKKAFGLDEINFSAMVGKEGYAILGISSSEQYGDQNEVKKFITGA